MRILHTSDWHLGVSHGATSRAPDHDRFLAWLEAELAAREVDVLIVAGDVFDAMQPPADAQARYYRFLGRVGRSGVAQVVVVGGNHDGASRLDAPADVLTALQVHVVGGIGGSEASWERCVVPLRDRAGEPLAVALAVPYVHEFRLGVRTTDLDRAGVQRAFAERFRALYTRLTDLAVERFPGLPIVATGHLTLGPSRREDYPQEIHQVGQIDGLPTSVLDPRIQYVALGHVHRCMPVDPEGRAWYSGSPIAFTATEAATPRRVLQVDLDPAPGGRPTVTEVEVPAPRRLIVLRDTPDALVAAVAGLAWDEPLPPLLLCQVVAEAAPPDLFPRLLAALGAFDEASRPALSELRVVRPEVERLDDAPATRPLAELGPAEVFAALCASVGERDEDGSLARAFDALAAASDEDLDRLIADAAGERA